MVYGAWFIFLWSIFQKRSEPIGLKFGQNASIGPEGDNKEYRDSFCSFFLIKDKKKPP